MIRDYHRGPPGQWRSAVAPSGGAGAMLRRRGPRRAARAAVAVALAGGVAWMGARAARAMPPWPYFRVAEVLVEGNLQLGREDVLAALHLPPGANLLTLDLAPLGARLAANPWVKEATLERRLPDRLLVRLVERGPAAILEADAAYLVSGDGVILEEAAQAEGSPALPVLRAPAGRRYAAGERVAPQELSEALWAWRQVQLASALGGRRPVVVALSPDGSYRVRMEPGSLSVQVRPEGLEPQLKRLGAVLALRDGGLDEVDEVDLRFPEKVILRPRAAGVRPGAGLVARGAAPAAARRPGTGQADPPGDDLRAPGLAGRGDVWPDPDRPAER